MPTMVSPNSLWFHALCETFLGTLKGTIDCGVLKMAQFAWKCLQLCYLVIGTFCGLLPANIVPRVLFQFEYRECVPTLGEICIDIKQCQFFTDLLDKTPIPRPRSIIRIIKNHQCGFEHNLPKVCCISYPTSTTTTTTEEPSTTRKRLVGNHMEYHRNYHLLPLERCGPISRQLLANRITSGQKTGLEEFPWMALVAYNTPGVGIEFRCGGTLINEDFVLTAAHCILNSTLIGVRLGEYDLKNKEPDCQDSYCSPPVQDSYISKTIVHPDYNPKTHENDVALIQLSRRANFTTNVQPICLPISEMNDDLTGKFAVVSGWGITEEGLTSSILRKASMPVFPLTTCRKIYDAYIPVTENQICAGGHNGQDSCAGDSGGPLIYAGLIDGYPRYIQYGIVSLGPKKCGTEGQPGLYTRVKAHLEWILDNIDLSTKPI